MNDDRRRILGMLAEGTITADEAEKLLSAMDRSSTAPALNTEPATRANRPKYFRVEVEDDDNGGEGRTKVNVRVPMQLLRAGVRLSALIPPQARDEVNRAMAREGIPFDINQLRPENLDELIEHLADFKVDVDSDRAKVRVYCE
ncbi:MAG TPA: hypothetical protein VMT68_17890 [Caulobacteraceae bacterium]|nr:hypothetical protein [Caulobacteraceae bacterium]